MSKEYNNEFYKKHGAHVHADPSRFAKIAELCRGFVLDLACGTGTLADFYKGPYTGIDISDVAVEYAKKIRRKDAKFFVADCTATFKTKNVKYDTIVLAEFLEHIGDDKIVLENVKQLLKPDGRIIVSVPNANRVPDEDHKRTFTIPELRKRFRPLGQVKFYNWLGASHRVLMTIDIGQKSEDLLSLCIFAKNEGKGIETALLSCLDFVDDIVVAVDTKSSDETNEIAKMYADTCVPFVWENSFCKARNYVQSLAKSPWILALDGHEFVEQHDNIKQLLNTDKDSYFVKIVLENGFNFYFPRIVRKEIVWDQDVHNRPNVKKPAKLHNFIIKHDRTNLQSEKAIKERNEQRNKMVNGILKEQLKEDKHNARAWFYLGQQYHFNKDFRKAIKCYRKYIKNSKDPQERWLAYHYIATIYINEKKYLRCLWTCFKSNDELPGRWETYKMIGILYMLIQKYEPACEYFVASLEKPKTTYIYNPEPVDLSQIWDFLGMCLQKLGKDDEARRAWARAVELADKGEMKNKLKAKIEILKRMAK